MNWVTAIWYLGSGACLTLALIQLVVWWNDRTARANLLFSVMAIAVAALAALELTLMRAETPEQFGMVARWMHVPQGFNQFLRLGRPLCCLAIQPHKISLVCLPQPITRAPDQLIVGSIPAGNVLIGKHRAKAQKVRTKSEQA